MADFNMPPPSYEDAMSKYIPPTNQFFRSAPPFAKPSAPPSDDEIVLSSTGALLPQSRPSSSQSPQSSQAMVYRTSRLTSQRITVPREQSSYSDNNKKFCYFITIFSLGFFIFIVVMIIKVTNQRAARIASYKEDSI